MIGTFLLMLPFSTSSGKGASFIDALFTSASAVCVTGLIVVDTPVYYSFFGQIVILVLIQVGGLGYMTIASLIAILLRQRISLKDRLVLQEALNVLTMEGIVRFVKRIIKITIFVESLGAAILTLRWMSEFPLQKAFFFAIFHSISAFNNAGFSLFSDNLIRYVQDPTINLVITSNIIIGGIGYLVINEIYENYRKKSNMVHLSLHTKLALSTTAILIVSGTIFIYLFGIGSKETFGSMSFSTKLFASYFQAVTPRTAGFNTVNIGAMAEPAIVILMMLMFIGASPGGTGGGIKTTTFGTIISTVNSTILGREEVRLFKRKIPQDCIRKAFNLGCVAFLLVITISFILVYIENQPFLKVAFEVTSAFGTVGLSIGAPGILTSLSTVFSAFGKLLIVLTMFAGRVGPITVGAAMLSGGESEPQYHYPEERVLIG